MSRRRLRSFTALLWFAPLLSCAEGPAPEPSRDAAAMPDAPPPARCRPPSGVSGTPRTIFEVAALANALPHPLSLTCFLESLDRPLALHAAVSTISLQPAPAARS